MGIARTVAETKLKYFWEGMHREIVNWVNYCEVCTQRKRSQVQVRVHLTPMPINEPFERYSGTTIHVQGQ